MANTSPVTDAKIKLTIDGQTGPAYPKPEGTAGEKLVGTEWSCDVST